MHRVPWRRALAAATLAAVAALTTACGGSKSDIDKPNPNDGIVIGFELASSDGKQCRLTLDRNVGPNVTQLYQADRNSPNFCTAARLAAEDQTSYTYGFPSSGSPPSKIMVRYYPRYALVAYIGLGSDGCSLTYHAPTGETWALYHVKDPAECTQTYSGTAAAAALTRKWFGLSAQTGDKVE